MHRVVITAILLAAKFFDDAYYNNAYYSKVGGVLVSEMNGLEVDFLFRINFSLHVTPDVFDKYRAELVSHSVSAGLTMPPQQQQQHLQALDMQSSNDAARISSVDTLQQAQITSATMPLPTQPLHYAPPHVTPSPHHGAEPLSAPYADQRNGSSNSNCHPMYAASDHLFPNGVPNGVTQQQFLQIQRANSMPAQFPGHSGGCAHNPPYSAPNASMLPGGVVNDQYLMLNNQLYPLQTTLVHHHHGVESYDPNSYHRPEKVNGGYPIGRADPVGSLVGGHY